MCDIDMTDEALSTIIPFHDSWPPPRCPRLSPLSLGKRSRDNDHFRTELPGDGDMHIDLLHSAPRSPTTPVSKKTKRARFASDPAASPRSSRTFVQDDLEEVPGWAPQHPHTPPRLPSFGDQTNELHPNPSPSIPLVRPPTPVTHRKASRYLTERPLTLTHPQLNSFSASLPSVNHAPLGSDLDGMEETTPTLSRTAYFGPSYYSTFPYDELPDDEEDMDNYLRRSSLPSSISSSTSSSSWQDYTSNETTYQHHYIPHQEYHPTPGLIAPRPVPAHIPLLNNDSFFSESTLHYSLAPGSSHSHYTYSTSPLDVFDHPTRDSMRPSSTSSYSSASSTESPFLSSAEERDTEDDSERPTHAQPFPAHDGGCSETGIQQHKWLAGEWFDPPTEFADLTGQLHRRRDSENEELLGKHFGYW